MKVSSARTYAHCLSRFSMTQICKALSTPWWHQQCSKDNTQVNSPEKHSQFEQFRINTQNQGMQTKHKGNTLEDKPEQTHKWASYINDQTPSKTCLPSRTPYTRTNDKTGLQ